MGWLLQEPRCPHFQARTVNKIRTQAEDLAHPVGPARLPGTRWLRNAERGQGEDRDSQGTHSPPCAAGAVKVTLFPDGQDAGSNTLAVQRMRTETGNLLGCLRNQRVRVEALSHGSSLVFSECWLLPLAVLGDMSAVPPPLSVSLFSLPPGRGSLQLDTGRGWGPDLACGWTGQLSQAGHRRG